MGFAPGRAEIPIVEVGVPHGYLYEGVWRHSLWLRAWNGHDESVLADEEERRYPAAKTTMLLSRCVYLNSEHQLVSTDFVRNLSAGDREALLLHLRRISQGEEASVVLTCAQCKELMELDLKVDDLISPPGSCAGGPHETTLENEGARYEIRFRVPNGGDLELAAPLALRDPENAESLVLSRCVSEVGGDAGDPRELPVLIAQLCEEMKRLDPQAEVVLEGECHHCGEGFAARLDAAQLVFRELERARPALDRDVHLLAYYYHWRENEILSMSGARRARYIRYLLDRLSEARRS